MCPPYEYGHNHIRQFSSAEFQADSPDYNRSGG